MSEYPRLSQLGISEPELITGYVINSMHRVDILRITQKREQGSLLPTSRSWEFPRIQQTPVPDKKAGTVLMTSPILREIEAELKDLLAKKYKALTTAEALREELEALEKEFKMRMRHLYQTLEELEKV